MSDFIDFSKVLSDRKMIIAIAVTITAFVLFVVAPFGSLVFPILQLSLGEEGFAAILIVSMFALLFYGLGYVGKEQSKESLHFWDKRNLTVLAVMFLLSVSAAFSSRIIVLAPYAPLVAIQLTIFGGVIVFLDYYSLKNSIISGINLFMIAFFAFLFMQGVLLQLGAAVTDLSNGGVQAIPNATLDFFTVILTILVFAIGYEIFKSFKSQTKAVAKLVNGSGKRIPIPFLYPAVVSIVLASILIALVFAGITAMDSYGNNMLTSYVTFNGTHILTGGVVYLLSSNNFYASPYPESVGGIGVANYFSYLASDGSLLYVSGTNTIFVPEYLHVVFSSIFLVAVSVLIAKFWTKLISKRLKLENPIPKKEWLYGTAALAILVSFASVMWLSGGMALFYAAAVVYFLREGNK